MDNVFNLIPNKTISLNGNNYKLLDIVGVGGFSAVYLAEANDGVSEGIVMIKEYRTSEPDALKLSKIKKMAVQEAKVVKELRDDRTSLPASIRGMKPDKTNNPWMFNYSEPIEEGDAIYIIIRGVKTGKTLASLMDEDSGIFYKKDFLYKCKCISAILDAVEYIHSKGYLHLDISPENIFVPEYMDGYKDILHVQIIDWHTAIKKGMPQDDWEPLGKENYSAPELKNIGTNPINLDDSTDLYSVAAIFFEMLVGRKLNTNDYGSLNEWKLTKNSKCFVNEAHLKNLLVKATNDFLHRGIADHELCRFEYVAQMKEELEDLIDDRLTELRKMQGRHQLVNITYNANGGWFVGEDRTYDSYGTFVFVDQEIRLDAPMHQKYWFNGWHLDSKTWVYSSKEFWLEVPSNEVVLTADWEPQIIVVYFTERGQFTNGGQKTYQVLSCDSVLNIPEVLAPDGWELQGWYFGENIQITDIEQLKKEINSHGITDITLKARWEPVQTQIEFDTEIVPIKILWDANGDKLVRIGKYYVSSSVEVVVNGSFTIYTAVPTSSTNLKQVVDTCRLLPPPIRGGWSFDGWYFKTTHVKLPEELWAIIKDYIDGTPEELKHELGRLQTDNIVLVAKWSQLYV